MYTNFAKISDGQITEYPLSKESYEAIFSVMDQTTDSTPISLESLGVTQVRVIDRRVTDAYNYTLGTPELIGGEWVVNWVRTSDEISDAQIELITQIASRSARKHRDVLINECQWRFERYARLARLSQPQIDDITKLDAYVQALADVPSQAGWPFAIQWPVYTNTTT